MTTAPNEIAGLIFRASPAFELRAFDALEPQQREVLAEYQQGEYFGVLLPQDNSRSAKLVGHDAARVFAALCQPGRAVDRLGSLAQNEEAVIALVLDGVLEVQEIGGSGDFLSGAPALARLGLQQTTVVDEPSNRVEQLSLEALRYAERLGLDDARLLAGRLYAYNRVPASAALLERFGEVDRVAEELGLDRAIRVLEPGWGYARPDQTHAWHAWERRIPRSMPPQPTTATAGWTYKLYLSPLPHVLRDALSVWVEHATELGAFSFKLGKDALGVLRPDKFVAYFAAFDSLERAAALLSAKLSGLPAQGVPFSAALDANGLLSWGTDPPHGPDAATGRPSGRESWRSWLTERLAAAIVEGRRGTSGGLPPHRFALERVRLEGVDTRTWTARDDIWSEPETVPDGFEPASTTPSRTVLAERLESEVAV